MSDAGDALKIIDKAADLLHKLAGPMADEFGAMLGDKVRVYRVKNLVATMQKTENILREAGISPNAVPPRLLLPIIENSSVEDNETLQEMWAGLLATASDQTDSVSPSFVETLKQLTPRQAKILESAIENVFQIDTPSKSFLLYVAINRSIDREQYQRLMDSFERLGIVRREYELRPSNRKRVNFDWAHGASGAISSLQKELEKDPELNYDIVFTSYGYDFLRACHGPNNL